MNRLYNSAPLAYCRARVIPIATIPAPSMPRKNRDLMSYRMLCALFDSDYPASVRCHLGIVSDVHDCYSAFHKSTVEC